VKRLLVFLLVLAAVVPAQAAAHPLGNFTTNHFSRVAASGDRVYVKYVLDLAEIPTFQERSHVARVGRAAYARELVGQVSRRISLRVSGKPVSLHELQHALAFPPGAAGLRTTRLEAVFASPRLAGGPRALVYRDETFPGRIGWKEIVVQGGAGARIDASSVPARSSSDELRSYPKDLLSSPLEQRSARATIEPGPNEGVAPSLSTGKALDSRVVTHASDAGGFESLIAKDNLSVGFVLVALLLAFFWGAAHALSPGHGKSIVAAYLVGSRGTPRHALLLGATVTITHTIGVFALGLVTLALSEFILPEQLYPWLNLVSALLVVGVGCSVLRARMRHRRAHVHDHHHHHDHDHDHSHDQTLSLRGLLGVGISGGLIPCPTALVVLLAAISLHRVGYGLVLIVAFSLGLAATISGIGLVAVSAKRLSSRVRLDGTVVRVLPALSAAVVLLLGVGMTLRALPKVI
jgi:ABC-type nickel/cobalt efflux system permease component RcnA